jgi:hypothetical protein
MPIGSMNSPDSDFGFVSRQDTKRAKEEGDRRAREGDHGKRWILTGRNGNKRDELSSVFSAAFCEDATKKETANLTTKHTKFTKKES